MFRYVFVECRNHQHKITLFASRARSDTINCIESQTKFQSLSVDDVKCYQSTAITDNRQTMNVSNRHVQLYYCFDHNIITIYPTKQSRRFYYVSVKIKSVRRCCCEHFTFCIKRSFHSSDAHRVSHFVVNSSKSDTNNVTKRGNTNQNGNIL